ncbi:ABC transporter permease [Iamia sp. SCSIO 61187]|uniref:ABC transporter permease n=1 Tax=Iamia sp. SCSIO 61187 TaxID=2722752 RepID=UPI001C62F0CB|nr:ABC transporter permease [Iamia sp. SCSIO 61187]QYG95154.1 ABC transporter permease [Iamia sp. SCSIO 61187]
MSAIDTTTIAHTESARVSEASVLAVLATGERPARPGPLSASITHGWRAVLKIKHVPEQLFDVTMFPAMMLLLFTYLFGGALGGSVSEYVQTFVPGILVSTVIMITMYTGVGLNNDMAKGVSDRFRSLPSWRPAAVVGALLGDAIRYAIASTVILTLGIILGFRPDGGVLGVLGGVAVLLVFAFSLSWAWTFLGMKLETEKAVMGVSMMFLFPLSFASNIFVDPATMPGWLQGVVEVNPVTLVVDAVRGLMAGSAQAADLGWVAVASAVFLGVFGPLTMRTYGRQG